MLNEYALVMPVFFGVRVIETGLLTVSTHSTHQLLTISRGFNITASYHVL
jgi:hypothetical protein